MLAAAQLLWTLHQQAAGNILLQQRGKPGTVLRDADHASVMGGNDHPGPDGAGQVRCLRGVHGVGAADGEEGNIAANGQGLRCTVGIACHIADPTVGLRDIAYPAVFPGMKGLVQVIGRNGAENYARQRGGLPGLYRQKGRATDRATSRILSGTMRTVSCRATRRISSGEKWS